MAPSRLAPNATFDSSTLRKRSAKTRLAMKMGVNQMHHRQQEARQRVQAQQEVDGHHPGHGERRQQGHVQQRRARRPPAPRHLDGRQHGDQHAGEHERVDEPGGAEQQRELDDALGLQQQEGGAHEEQVHVLRHGPQRPETTRTRATDAARMSSSVTR